MKDGVNIRFGGIACPARCSEEAGVLAGKPQYGSVLGVVDNDQRTVFLNPAMTRLTSHLASA